MLKTWKLRTWGTITREGLPMGGGEDSTGVRMTKGICLACRIIMGMGRGQKPPMGRNKGRGGDERGIGNDFNNGGR